jgi:hypothetical protein
MTPQTRKRLHPLFSAVVDGTIDEPGSRELTALLETDAEARRLYIQYLDMHAALSNVQQLPKASLGRRTPRMMVAASAAAILGLAACFLLIWVNLPTPRAASAVAGGRQAMVATQTAADAAYIATLTSVSSDAALNGRVVPLGKRLVPGHYEVTQGEVTVQFDGGARVFFECDCKPLFTLTSRRSMSVHRGTFVFEGDQFTESIEVSTPYSVFKNIGTRYALIVGDQAEELHVLKGAVRRTTSADGSPSHHDLIGAGVGMRYPAGNGTRESIPLNAALVEKQQETVSLRAVAQQPLVEDDFRGVGDELAKRRSGRGWSEAWRSPRGGYVVVSPGLKGPESVAVKNSGEGKKPEDRRVAAHRRFAEPIDLRQDSIHYLRFFVRRGPRQGNDEHRAMIVLRSGSLDPKEELEQAALIQIALRRDDGVLVRVGDSLKRALIPQDAGESYALIAKIVSGRDTPEQVLLQVMAANRLAGSKEPEDWSVVSESVATDIVLEQLSIECTTASWVEIGEICIGPTWESVTRPRPAIAD